MCVGRWHNSKRQVWRYERGNDKLSIEEGLTKNNRNKKHKQTNNGPQTATQKNRIEEQAPYY